MVTLDQGIRLHSGTMFDYSNPAASDVTIEDIAHALSHICRFAGHIDHFYSVAQHAVNCSFIVPPEHAFTALCHDTAEAFTNDIPTPLKFAVPMFKELEVRIESAMAARFGFTYPLPDTVKTADLQMLQLEKNELKSTEGDWEVLAGIESDHLRPFVDLSSWAPEHAKFEFLDRFKELCP
jgi:hypothetical protein